MRYKVDVFPLPHNAYREDESDDDSTWRWLACVHVWRGPGDDFPHFRVRRTIDARRGYQWAWAMIGRLRSEMEATNG